MTFLDRLEQAVAPAAEGLRQRSRRHAAIAANVANADTPGYRARDLTFAGAMRRAGLSLTRTDPRHLGGGTGAGPRDRLVLSGGTPRRDGNDVDVDREMVKLAKNQIEYQFLARSLGGKFRKFKQAITGRATP